jgi:hypothetical protein
MFKPEDVLEGSRQIRYFLPELVGSELAQTIDDKLAELLEQAQTEQQVHEQILELLKRHPATRHWIAEFLSPKQVSKGYEPLPGSGGAIAAQKFICPKGDYVWYQRAVGASTPTCPTHGELICAD